MGAIAGLSRANFEVIQKMKAQKENVESFEDETHSIYIDKAWEGIGFILVGALGPRDNILSEIIFPKESFVIDEDEFMPVYVNYSSPQKVKQIHHEIKNISKADFKRLFNQRDFKTHEIYPFMGKTLDNEDFEYLYLHFREIQMLFKEAAAENEFVVVTID